MMKYLPCFLAELQCKTDFREILGGEMDYRKSRLENGICVITETMPEVHSVAIGIQVNASPRNDPPGKDGLAHLVEHGMFQGTSSRSARQIAQLMDVGGGQIGAFTTRDYTCYVATVLDDYYPYALDLLGDVLLNSTFPPDNIESEKTAILREIDAAGDSPSEKANTLLKASAWPDHPLGKPVTGLPDTVKSLTREDIIYFMHEHYVPDNIIIAASGHINHDDFVAQVRDAFWRLLGENGRGHAVAPSYQRSVRLETMPVSQTYFALGIQTYPYTHPNRYGLHLLNSILGGGISSRLFHHIREERGLVYNISSEYHPYLDAGMLVIEGSTTPEYLIPVLGLTLVDLWQLITGASPVDEEELWKAKMGIRGQHLIASELPNTRMSRLTTQQFYFGKYISSEEILSKIEGVDIQDLQQLAEEDLLPALPQVSLAIVGPEAPQHYNLSSIEELLADFQ